MATDAPSTSDAPGAKDKEQEEAAGKAAEKIPRTWSESEEGNLIAGVCTLGVGNWEAIRLDPAYNLRHRTAMQLKDKWRNLVKYRHVVPEDFPTYADISRRRRTEALLAIDFPTIDLRHTRSMQNFPALPSPQKQKKHRVSSPEPPPSFNDLQKPLQTSKFTHPKIRVKSETARSCPAALSLEVPHPVSKDELAQDFIREALLIQSDANALAASAMAASTRPDVDQKEIRETIRSANMIASLAQEKSLKSRDLLERMLSDISTPEEAATTAQLLKETRADADDTTHSSCQTTQKLHGSPSDARSPEDCGTSAVMEAPALAVSSSTPEQLFEAAEHGVQDNRCRDDTAFSRANIFERFGLDEWVSLILDEVVEEGDLPADADVLNHSHRDAAICGDFVFGNQ